MDGAGWAAVAEEGAAEAMEGTAKSVGAEIDLARDDTSRGEVLPCSVLGNFLDGD